MPGRPEQKAPWGPGWNCLQTFSWAAALALQVTGPLCWGLPGRSPAARLRLSTPPTRAVTPWGSLPAMIFLLRTWKHQQDRICNSCAGGATETGSPACSESQHESALGPGPEPPVRLLSPGPQATAPLGPPVGSTAPTSRRAAGLITLPPVLWLCCLHCAHKYQSRTKAVIRVQP